MIRISYISDIINLHRPIITHNHIYQWYTCEREGHRGGGVWMDRRMDKQADRYTNDIPVYF